MEEAVLVYRLFQLLLLLTGAAASAESRRDGCPTTCGDVDIPYPFSIGPNCFRAGFELSCNKTEAGVEKPFFFNVEIIDISLPLGQARMLNHISHQCCDSRNKSIEHDDWYLNLDDTPYRFSDVHNKFTVIGCDTLAYIGSVQKNNSYWSGCVSMCNDELSLVNGSCSGIGCCQTSIPKGLTYYTVSFDPSFNSSGVFNFSRCSYAVLLEANGFNFSSSYITTTEFMDMNNRKAPLVVDWAIGNETCEAAIQNRTSYACISANSACFNSTNGPGYLCKCSSGYQGNPYVHDGCQDIDECADKDLYPCHGKCNNTVGSYECWCPPGTHGNPYFNGTCTPNQKLPLAVKIVIGVGLTAQIQPIVG